MHWHQIKNKIKRYKKLLIHDINVCLWLHYFPERQFNLQLCAYRFSFCRQVTLILKTLVNTTKKIKIKSVSECQTVQVECRGQALGGVSLACWRKTIIKLLCLNTPKLQLNILHPWCHTSWIQMEREKRLKLLYLVCWGGCVVVEVVEVVEGCRALVRVKRVSGPTAQSRITVYRGVRSWAAVLWSNELPGLIQQLLQRTAGQRIIPLVRDGERGFKWSAVR